MNEREFAYNCNARVGLLSLAAAIYPALFSRTMPLDAPPTIESLGTVLMTQQAVFLLGTFLGFLYVVLPVPQVACSAVNGSHLQQAVWTVAASGILLCAHLPLGCAVHQDAGEPLPGVDGASAVIISTSIY